MASPIWLAVKVQVPALRTVTVAVLLVPTVVVVPAVQTVGVMLAKTTGLPDAPPVALKPSVNVGL